TGWRSRSTLTTHPRASGWPAKAGPPQPENVDEARVRLGLVLHVFVLVRPAVAAASAKTGRRGRELLEAERDPPPSGVDPDHLPLQVLPDLEDVLGALHVIPRELRDVKQALDAGHDLKEGAVLLGLGDLALHDRADGHRLNELLPGVLLELPERKRDARLLGVELDHLHGDLVPQ